jgi:drug/metabolite transporter (DMT)-like permease
VSYESTDVSLAYPLTTTGPLYIPLWAFIFLGERLSLAGGLGIFLVVSGTYVIQMKKISMKGIFEPLRNLKAPGVLLALAAGFFYSIGAVLDKKTVSGHDVFTYTYYLDIVLVTFLIFGNLLSRERRSGYHHELREHWPKILLAGGVLFCSFLTYRLGLKMAKVSYAASARQVSALFGVFFGIFLFREFFGRIRITGALLITLGIILIKFG